MKKTLATLLSASMLLSVAAVAGSSVSAAEPERVEGLTMTSYIFKAAAPEWGDAYKHIMGQKSMGYQLNYDTNKMFDQTIDDLLDWSAPTGDEKVTGFGNPDDIVNNRGIKVGSGNYLNNYLIKWEGKVTAADAVKITVVGNKIDNGFVMSIDGKRVYEYWGTAYFDKDEDKLPSDLGAVDLTKGEHTIEAWFLEIDGGAPLDMGVYIGDSEEYKSFADAGLSFDMKATVYHTFLDRWGDEGNLEHPWAKAFADAGQPKGNNGNGGNGAQCTPDNQKYKDTIQAMIDSSKKIGSLVHPRIDPFTLAPTDESYMNTYEGFVSVEETGWYLFGCEKVDNAFYLEIDGKVAFEVWAYATWNDDGSWAWMPNESAIYMEAGKTYPLKAAFAEFNGGQALWPRVKVSTDDKATYGDPVDMNGGILKYTTTLPTDNDQVAASAITGEGVTKLNDKINLDTVATDIDGLWEADGPITNIFDDNKETKFGASGKWEGGTITWQTTEPITVSHYKIVAANDNDGTQRPRIPVAWVLLGSNDGKTYNIIDKVSRGQGGIAANNFAEAVFEVDEPAAYSYYKFQVVGTWSPWDGDNGSNGGDQTVCLSFADLTLYNAPKTQQPDTTPDQPGTGGDKPGTPDKPGTDKPVKPAPTGSASVAISAVAVISLAGVVVAAKKREQD